MSQENQDLQQQGQESAQEQNDKISKRYERALSVVAAVVGGEQNLRPRTKLAGDATAEVVAELFAEEQKATRAAVKEGLKTLLKKHVELESDLKKKEKELEQLRQQKRKEFTEACNQWLQKIDQSAVQQESYAAALQTAFAGEQAATDQATPETPQA